jgi:23S rRNA U2552 (ribose-2'-O)-methylase RlmE/FtsJ
LQQCKYIKEEKLIPILWTLHRYPVQKLRENNVEGIDIMQISGHKNVAFINNYSTLSEERHKKISNILSNTETNRN